MKSTEVQTLSACATPLIDGLGYECAFTRGLHASWSSESLTQASYTIRWHADVGTASNHAVRDTDRPSTVNLASHVRRGLKILQLFFGYGGGEEATHPTCSHHVCIVASCVQGLTHKCIKLIVKLVV